MKILFICGSLESGKDGVGDYTLSLASELVRLKHDVQVIGLIDKFADFIIDSEKTIRRQAVPCLRIPSSTPWSRRKIFLDEAIQSFQPDIISLQFVPWTYGPKGCVYGLGHRLAGISEYAAPVHIMFHELWIHSAPEDPLKQRVLGFVQKHSIQALIRSLRPSICQTSTPLFLNRLSTVKQDASLLPLFGNIEISKEEAPDDHWWLKQQDANAPREVWRLAGVFGTLHPNWDPCPALQSCLTDAETNGLRLGLVLMGRNGHYADNFKKQLSKTFCNQITLFDCGELEEADISRIFSQLDFGIATSPIGLIGKSGSAIAMLEHGLPLLVTRKDVIGPDTPTPENFIANRATLFEVDNFDWSTFLGAITEPESKLSSIAHQFIRDVTHTQNI